MQSYNIAGYSQLFYLTLKKDWTLNPTDMKILRIYPTNINRLFIDEAVEALRSGGIILYPTDTLYAIGCDATNARAIERVCRIKNINPAKQTLSIVCSDLSQASEYARIDNNAFRLMRANLPGPFTFVLPATPRLPKLFKGRKTVGIRVPSNEITLALADALGSPILSTSVPVNRDAPEESADAQSLASIFNGRIDLAIDGGSGILTPSAVIDISEDPTDPVILREGPKQLTI